VLARLSARKDERELVVGEAGIFGGSVGPQSKDTVELKIEKLAPGVYKVIPERPIPSGEYCFFYAGAGGAAGPSGGKRFDFGIDLPRSEMLRENSPFDDQVAAGRLPGIS